MSPKRAASTPAEPATDGLEVRETFKRASEFAPHVTVTEETFFSHGWQPLTISILQTLWFLPSDTAFDIPFLIRETQIEHGQASKRLFVCCTALFGPVRKALYRHRRAALTMAP
ncbi:hypothetical protein ACWGJX_43440 [Streptomyces sp. NPDC054775]